MQLYNRGCAVSIELTANEKKVLTAPFKLGLVFFTRSMAVQHRLNVRRL